MIKRTSSPSPLWFWTRLAMYSSAQRVMLIRVWMLSRTASVLSRPSRCDQHCVGRGRDQAQHVVGMRDHRHVIGRDFDGGCAHSGGELSLGLRRDRLVTVGDEE